MLQLKNRIQIILCLLKPLQPAARGPKGIGRNQPKLSSSHHFVQNPPNLEQNPTVEIVGLKSTHFCCRQVVVTTKIWTTCLQFLSLKVFFVRSCRQLQVLIYESTVQKFGDSRLLKCSNITFSAQRNLALFLGRKKHVFVNPHPSNGKEGDVNPLSSDLMGLAKERNVNMSLLCCNTSSWFHSKMARKIHLLPRS